MRRLLTGIAAAAALSVLAVACGSSDDNTGATSGTTPTATSGATPTGTTGAPATTAATSTPATTTSGGGAAAEIEIEGFQYVVPASVSPGQSIKVENKDGAGHTVTSGQGRGQFDLDVDGGATGTFNAPSTPGTYEIICTYHPNMRGTLVVK